MADEYAPTTREIESAYVCDSLGAGIDEAEARRRFSRRLAAHDAEIREQALAPIRTALDGHPVCDTRPDDDYPSCGWKRAVADVRRALDA